MQKGIIEKIDSSPWISPIVVTAKKGGKIRLCVDLREPNKALIVDSHPLPHMEELLSDLRGASVFTTIDLAAAYHQLTLHEECRTSQLLSRTMASSDIAGFRTALPLPQLRFKK